MKRGFGLLLVLAVVAGAGLALWGVPAPPAYTVEGMPRRGVLMPTPGDLAVPLVLSPGLAPDFQALASGCSL